MKQIILILLSVLSIVCVKASTYTIDNIPNVHLKDKYQFVSDPDGYLSNDAKNRVNQYMRALMDSTSAEAAIVLVESVGDTDIDSFAQQLFDKWKIGKSDKDNGLLLIFVMDQRKARIHTGYGLEGIIPDITAKNIINNDIIPHMKNGDIDNAIVSASKHIYQICTNPENKDEIWSGQKNDNITDNSSSELKTIMIMIVLLSFIFSLTIFFNNISKLKGKTNYQKAEIMGHNLWVLAITSILSAFLGTIFFIVSIILSKYFRNKPIKCANCNSNMTKLSEEEDNQYLTPSQDREERLKSVDYDVWLCPKCGETEIFPFKSKTTTYQKCPYCNTYASTHVLDRIIKKPTTTIVGIGVHIYECQYCRNRHEIKYEIPKIVPIVAIGGSGNGFGGGGGFSGGSFGGGMSGGGGASGGW